MRQGQQNRRGRGRPNNNNRSKGQNPLTRSFQSNGPDVKIHGTPSHIAEKYITLARDSLSSGDIVMAENYLQHAEHYNRIILTYREQQVQPQHDSAHSGGQSRPAGSNAGEQAESVIAEETGTKAGGGHEAIRGSEPQPHLDDVAAQEEDGRGRRQPAKPRGRPPRTPRPARGSDSANGERPRAGAQSSRRQSEGSGISDGQDAPGFLRNPVARASRATAPEPEVAAPVAEDDKT